MHFCELLSLAESLSFPIDSIEFVTAGRQLDHVFRLFVVLALNDQFIGLGL